MYPTFFFGWEIIKWLPPPWAGREEVSDFYCLKPIHVPSCALCVPGLRYVFWATRSPGKHRPWLASPVANVSLRRAWNTNASSTRLVPLIRGTFIQAMEQIHTCVRKNRYFIYVETFLLMYWGLVHKELYTHTHTITPVFPERLRRDVPMYRYPRLAGMFRSHVIGGEPIAINRQ